MNGTRVPPSLVVILNPRNGPFDDVVDLVGPPLSDRKITSVFFSRPASRSLSITLPTASSTAESIAQNVWRFLSAMLGKRARYFGVASSGACTPLKGRYRK